MKHRSITTGRFALTGLALAAACSIGSSAWALGLGRLNVQSVLGETLRAEIDVTSITAEEAASLRLRVASPDAYRAAGIEYNAALAGATVTLDRRADGRPFLRVTSDRTILEPFVDVIVEATWSSGRLVREYTLLFDPPATRTAAAPAPATAPAIAAAPAVPAPIAPPRAAAPAVAAPRPTPAPRAAAPAPVQAPVLASPAASGDEYRVRRGDSLSGIAVKTQRSGVSLDQMLVALFRGNPDAFMGENMNRLKAGAVLSVPSAETAQQLSAAQARGIIRAQATDFSNYRQRLASGAPTMGDVTSPRQAAGKVQAQVDDKKLPAAGTPDKLKLSQGAVKGAAPEAKVSQESEKKDAASRLAELSRNVDELKKLQQGTSTAAATPPAPAPAPAPVVAAAPPPPPVVPPAPPAAPVVAPTPAAPPAAPAVAAAPPPAPPTPTPAPVVTPPPPKPETAKTEEPGLLASLMESPLLLPGAGVLVALLAGLGIYRLRGGGRKRAGETSFLESRLQPDSFFGASGGQRVDTKDGGSSGQSSSMSYSLSQLDAIGDVDPVAEADVYLAYGRDLQAEEILKEAMRSSPDRLAVRVKLLEVYAKRRDTKAYELLATQLHTMTKGEGDDWAKVQAMGHDIDPENALYMPGGKPSPILDERGEEVEVLNASTVPHTAKPAPPTFRPASDATLDAGAAVDLDLDISSEAPTGANEATQPLNTAAEIASEPMAFDPTVSLRGMAPTEPVMSQKAQHGTLDFDLGNLDVPPPAQSAAPAPAMAPSLGDDFGDFTLPNAALESAEGGDPLQRKLELAEEFRQIGDIEGARDLLEEVVAKAEGAIKAKAQGMLSGLA